MNFRTFAYLVAILLWLSMMYVAAHRANGAEDAMILLLGALSLGGLTLLVLDSIRHVRGK